MKSKSAAQNNTVDNPGKLLQNIDHAKNWLDKAKDEFNDLNSVRGELNLSLAQAEVKRAWELSREQCVSTLQEIQPATIRKSAILLPLAAGFGILMLVAGAVFWVKLQDPGIKARHIEAVSPAPPVPTAGLAVAKSISTQPAAQENPVVPVAPLIRVESLPRAAVANQATHPVMRLERPEPERKISVVETPVVAASVATAPIVAAPIVAQLPETVKNETVVVKDTPVAVETPVKKAAPTVQETASVAAVEPPRQNASAKVEASAAANSGRIHPALQLPEDDLANIAKRSLKTGR